MRRLLLILGNDIRRHLKAPLVIIIFIAIPAAHDRPDRHHLRSPDRRQPAAAHSGAPRRPRQGPCLAKLLLGAFDADEMKTMFQVTVTDEAEGRKRMETGKASAMVIIPERFTLDLLEAKPVTLSVVKNPAEQFLPDVVEEFMNTMAVMLSAAVQAFADEARGIRAMLDSPLESFSWEALGAGARQGTKEDDRRREIPQSPADPAEGRENAGRRRQNAVHPGGPVFGHPARHGDHVPAVHRPDRDARPAFRARGRQAPADDDDAPPAAGAHRGRASAGGLDHGPDRAPGHGRRRAA